MTRRFPALDRFRLLAAVLVVCIHTDPLASCTAAGNFLLTRVSARTAVPFFFMITGHFLEENQWKSTGKFLKRTLSIYLLAVLLYLPINLYNGGFPPLEWVRRLLADGTVYHLWYFPAVLLGVPLTRGLLRLGRRPAWILAAALYLLGLGGDSWYGLARTLPGAEAFYEACFHHFFSYTRNGLFFAPIFLLLGAESGKKRPVPLRFTLPALGLMTAEAIFLARIDWPRHDSMYLTLPLVMAGLFSQLLSRNQGQDRRARRLSLSIYLLHPWAVVLLRWMARAAGLEWLLLKNSLVRFLAVCALTALWALIGEALRPIPVPQTLRAWREIDREALVHNAKALTALLPPGCGLMAVVKANAYGHGAVPAARAFQKAGVQAFAAACLAEGIALRKGGVRGEILILGCTPPEAAPLLRRYGLTQTVADAAHGHALAAAGPVRVHLALDTGMHRLGIDWQDHADLLALYGERRLRITGLFSHLAEADNPAGEDFTRIQLNRFYETAGFLRRQGIDPGRLHVQASAGLLRLPPQPCGYARPGLALYGVSGGFGQADLRPALSLRARVALVREIPAGEGAGYDRAFRPESPARLAVVTIGYADGLPRSLPQQGGRVLIRGKSLPMAGRMCMDQLLVDVTAAPEVQAGDTATLLGRDGEERISPEELAKRCGTIPNEILSRLGGRLELVYR